MIVGDGAADENPSAIEVDFMRIFTQERLIRRIGDALQIFGELVICFWQP